MDPEIVKILEMIEQGKVTAEQGAELLKALRVSGPSGQDKAGDSDAAGCKPKVIGIYIKEGNGKNTQVRIPLGLARCFAKFVPRDVTAKFTAGGQQFDLGEFLKHMDSCDCGDVLTVDSDDGTKVLICCE